MLFRKRNPKALSKIFDLLKIGLVLGLYGDCVRHMEFIKSLNQHK